MVGASLYILVRSTRNRIAVRLRRLREPRYLFGAVIGAAYLYFAVFAAAARGRQARRPGVPRFRRGIGCCSAGSARRTGGAAVLLMAGLAWIFPGRAACSSFTRGRNRLSVSRARLASSVADPSHHPVAVRTSLRRHGAGVPVQQSGDDIDRRDVPARDRPLDHVRDHPNLFCRRDDGPRAARLGGSSRAAGGLDAAGRHGRGAWRGRGARRARSADFQTSSFEDVVTRLGTATTTGLPRIVLWPFQALLRPLFADGAAAYLMAIPGALLVLLATVRLGLDEQFGVLEESPRGRGGRTRNRVTRVRWPPVVRVRQVGAGARALSGRLGAGRSSGRTRCRRFSRRSTSR